MSVRWSEWLHSPEASPPQGAPDSWPTVTRQPNLPWQSPSPDAAAENAIAQSLRLISQALSSAWKHISKQIALGRAARGQRSLQLIETLPMGEKRFVAIVQVQQERFLIGGGSTGMSLLARLNDVREFATVLDERAASPSSSAAARAQEQE